MDRAWSTRGTQVCSLPQSNSYARAVSLSVAPHSLSRFEGSEESPLMSQQTWHSPHVVLPHAIKPAEDDVVLIANSDVEFFRPFTGRNVRPGWHGALLPQSQSDRETAAAPHDWAHRVGRAPASPGSCSMACSSMA